MEYIKNESPLNPHLNIKDRKLLYNPLGQKLCSLYVLCMSFFMSVTVCLWFNESVSSPPGPPDKNIFVNKTFWPAVLWTNLDALKNMVQLISYRRYLECTLIKWRLSIYTWGHSTGSCGYLFHEIPGIKELCMYQDMQSNLTALSVWFATRPSFYLNVSQNDSV